eukprot:490107-Heterocapsa_arctica.AAC.1
MAGRLRPRCLLPSARTLAKLAGGWRACDEHASRRACDEHASSARSRPGHPPSSRRPCTCSPEPSPSSP